MIKNKLKRHAELNSASLRSRTKFGMTEKKPLVSVIMPVFNAEKYVAEAIESILNQTCQNFELIIVDDASTDSSWKIIKQFEKDCPLHIKALHLTRNLNRGGDICVNEGIRYAKGKYIARMDADDISYPERLEKQVAYLEKHPNTFLVGSSAQVIDKYGRTIGKKMQPVSHNAIYKTFFTFNPLIHPTCMFRKKQKGKAFFYLTNYASHNDYDTFVQLICSGYRFANLPDTLLSYRIHDNNYTFVNLKKKYISTLQIRKRMLFSYGYKPQLSALIVVAIQTLLVLCLPEKVVLHLYLYAKGIEKIPNLFRVPYLSDAKSA